LHTATCRTQRDPSLRLRCELVDIISMQSGTLFFQPAVATAGLRSSRGTAALPLSCCFKAGEWAVLGGLPLAPNHPTFWRKAVPGLVPAGSQRGSLAALSTRLGASSSSSRSTRRRPVLAQAADNKEGQEGKTVKARWRRPHLGVLCPSQACRRAQCCPPQPDQHPPAFSAACSGGPEVPHRPTHCPLSPAACSTTRSLVTPARMSS
jgi:hypothetical protein